MSSEATLFHADPTRYLPHRPPFLFIDRILSLESGVSATGELAVTHGGYFPPVFLVEAMAQLGGIAAGQQEGEGGVLAGFKWVTLPPAVETGAKLLVTTKVIKVFGQLIQVEGEVREQRDAGATGEVIATGTVTLAIQPAPQG